MFESLDHLYVPAPDIKESVKYYARMLAGSWRRIYAYGVRVACVQVAKSEPPFFCWQTTSRS